MLNFEKIKNYINIKRGVIAKSTIATNHLLLIIVSLFFYNFQRSTYQIFSALSLAIVVELLCFRFFYRYKNDNITGRVISAITEAAGLLVLIRSLSPNYYAVASCIAIASKYIFVRFSDNKHIFNPTNFIIVLSLAFAPEGTLTLRADEFSYSLYPIFQVVALGTIATLLARVFIIPVTYLLTYFALGIFSEGWVNRSGFIEIVGPELGATGLVFIFLMITDPATCPKSRTGKIVFSITVASLGFLLRLNYTTFANYIALFIVYTVYNIYLLTDHLIRPKKVLVKQ